MQLRIKTQHESYTAHQYKQQLKWSAFNHAVSRLCRLVEGQAVGHGPRLSCKASGCIHQQHQTLTTNLHLYSPSLCSYRW